MDFEIKARDGAARCGVLMTAHGPVETPAFIPLATKGTVKSLTSEEVADLGYELILGNAYHLLISPGVEELKRNGGLHNFMGWQRALITDSGGFQIFSIGHGRVADEIKGRSKRPAGGANHGAILAIEEEGVRFRSYLDGREYSISPEISMQVQAAIGSDIALVFDECTPYHADRDYTASSMERTHRWLERSLDWHRHNGPQDQAVFGIVQGGTYEDLRRESAETVAAAAIDGIAIGGSLGSEKAQMYEVVGWTLKYLPVELPKHLLGIGEVDDLLAAVEQGVDIFDCAVPTRLARHGTALVPDPTKRWRLDLSKGVQLAVDEPLASGCGCRTCRTYSRAYLNYLVKAREITAIRLLTEHNLSFMTSLTSACRAAITDDRFSKLKSELLAGAAPFGVRS